MASLLFKYYHFLVNIYCVLGGVLSVVNFVKRVTNVYE